MKPVFAIVLLLFVASADADEGSCTFTYNPYSRSIVRSCTGSIPIPNLNAQESISLLTRKTRSCVIAADLDRVKKQLRITRRACE